jgi:trehalose 6-phosphate phosphatase
MQNPPLPARGSALFFDFDGTLAEIAPQPDAVHLDRVVREHLAALAQALAGAVAIVSGRPVAEIDHHLQPLRLPVAGVHGAERRGPDGFLRRIATPELGPARQLAEALKARHPALRLEVKPGALALHYRQAPELEDVCVSTMTEALGRVEGMALMCGKMVVELKPRRASKGQAVRAFLDERPFRSRRPWFFGDDVTDEAAFEAVLALGGVAVKIGDGETLAPYRLANPEALRDWMERAAAALGTPAKGGDGTGKAPHAAPTSAPSGLKIEP